MATAYSYIRFSTGKQAKGSSLERQEAMLDAWADKHPTYTLNRTLTFRDLGISGRSGKHLKNGFGKLLEAIDQGAIKAGDAVLVEAIDRTGRMEPGIMSEILIKILNSGVSLVTLDDNMMYTQESLRGGNYYILVGKVQAAFNYSQTLSDRMKASYKSRNTLAANGVIPKRYTPVWLTSQGELIQEIAPFIRQAFEDYASGLGERRIYERILEAGGNKHPCFVKMAPSTVKRWMKNRTAVGEWQGIPNVYPAVVTPDLFYRVQRKLAEGRVERSAPTKHKYTGLVRCGECGKNFNTKHYAKRKKGVTPPPPVMECSTRARRGSTACSNSKGIPEAVIAIAFQLSCWEHVHRALQGQVLTESMKREVVIDGLLADLSVKITKVAKVVAEVEDVEELIVTLQTLKAERKALETEKLSLQHSAATIRDTILNNVEVMKDPMKANALLQSVGYEIVCHLNRTIETPVGRFVYDGWSRSKDVYKVINPQGQMLEIPIIRDKPRNETRRIDVMKGLAGKLANVKIVK
ncbi:MULTISPECIES: recombinase family protein [unclassified Pseudomonas]|uniref:recombinase family protein n=1 Tax=unclassified Pseudomonas TaxID=196821 RepID=UPI0039B74066